VVAEHDGEGRF